MAEFQTVATSSNMVRGNGLVEVANYTAGEYTWHSVGAVKDLSVEEMFTMAKEESDNADSVDRVNKQELSIKFTQLEVLNLDVWEVMRSTLDTITQESNTTKIQSGAATEIPFFALRITTKNGGETFYFLAYKCQLQKGFNFQYQKDDSEDTRLQNPIEIMARTDAERGYFVYELEGAFNG